MKNKTETQCLSAYTHNTSLRSPCEHLTLLMILILCVSVLFSSETMQLREKVKLSNAASELLKPTFLSIVLFLNNYISGVLHKHERFLF